MIEVLHITPHLGGGVGKAVSGLIRASMSAFGHRHTVIALELPQKSQFNEVLTAAGCPIFYSPSISELHSAIAAADIVQLEFWNHPAMAQVLCESNLPPMRLIVWCHISGLYQPAIPKGLPNLADAFLFTSPSSLESKHRYPHLTKTHVVSSGGGMNEMPPPPQRKKSKFLRAGYLGSLNFSKLHPDFVRYLAAVNLPDFSFRMIGDPINRATLEAQCVALARPNLLEFCGYRTDIAKELANLDVMIYLLNPRHYGTAENTLLEAMAMGVIPIVLDNPSERHIVEHNKTGRIIRTPEELAHDLAWLANSPSDRKRLSEAAANSVRERYSYANMALSFDKHYRETVLNKKRQLAFRDIFGPTPGDWFLAFQSEGSYFFDAAVDSNAIPPSVAEQPDLYETTKGSVFHFLEYFPEDSRLSSWGKILRRYSDVAHQLPSSAVPP